MPAEKAVTAVSMSQTGWNSFSGSDTLTIIYSNRSAPVLRMALPQTSLLRDIENYHYSFSFITTCKDCAGLHPEALSRSFVRALPIWAKVIIRGSARLNKNLNERSYTQPAFDAGYAPFRIAYSTDDEVILQRKTKQRSVYVSILLSTPRRDALQKNIILSVLVETNNGRNGFYSRMLYKLFQTLMPAMLKRLVSRLHT